MFLDNDPSQNLAGRSFTERLVQANSNDESVLDVLSLDPDYRVRAEVARHCEDHLLETLLNNGEKSDFVLTTIACRGSKKLRDRLINHEKFSIRLAVAQYGDKDHCQILKFDRYPEVARVASSRIMADLF